MLAAAVGLLTACETETVTPDLAVFDDASRLTLDRAKDAVVKAETFDQRSFLSSIPAGKYDSRSIRFVDRWERATFSAGAGALGENETGATILEWAPAPDHGLLGQPEAALALEVDNLALGSIGAIRVTVGELGTGRATLEVVMTTGPDRREIALPLVIGSEGAAKQYTIDLRDSLGRDGAEFLTSLAISWKSGAEVRLESIEFLSRTWKFGDRWGVGSESIRGDTRPAVYVAGSGTLEWELEERWRSPRITFSLAEMVPGRTVRVSLELDMDGTRRRLFETDLTGGEGWRDFEVRVGDGDLSGARLGVSVTELENREAGVGVVLWGAPVMWEPPARRFNVMVLLEDALRADRMSMYGHQRDTTPFKAEFFQDGTVFRRCVSPATNTRFSCPSVMTALRPLANGVYGVWNPNSRLAQSYVTLAEVLQSKGWSTAAFLQNGNAGPDTGLGQGFDRVLENIPGRADAVYGGAAVTWLREMKDRNFFGYLHIADPHAPYEPPLKNRQWYEDFVAESGGPKWSDPDWVATARRALYDGEIASNDAALHLLTDELERLELLEDTLVVLIADHGEHLGEHDLWMHVPPSYIQVVHVPMLMRYPERIAAGRSVEEQVGTIDLMPTILDLADLDISGLPVHGRSLVPLVSTADRPWPQEVAFVQEAVLFSHPEDQRLMGSLFWDRWHFLNSLRAGPALFDYLSDRTEIRRLEPSRGFEERALGLLAELQIMDGEVRLRLGSGEESGVEMGLETIQNLEALGYLGE